MRRSTISAIPKSTNCLLRTKASSLYYKTKLQVHNFTLFNLNTKEGYCYLWNETEGDLSSEIFAHLRYRHFERVIKDNPDLKEIVVWSDGCRYQNLSEFVFTVFQS